MTLRNPLVAILLALILMVGSVVGGVERARMIGVSQATLCGSDGAADVRIDAAGNPVKVGHPCPHCLAAGTVAVLLGPAPTPMLADVRGVRLPPALFAALPPAQILQPLARGPPAVV